jgi:hypothetical protein
MTKIDKFAIGIVLLAATYTKLHPVIRPIVNGQIVADSLRSSRVISRKIDNYGSVAEWFKAAVLKTDGHKIPIDGCKGLVGSNPTTSANFYTWQAG